ncbi:MAG: hypothetical protein UX81_C0007G0018 [Parcubacteria group bacterium GW2011_GWA2_47_12]|nr:MAG: hypothetical protein UX81_C0007G0018 [Parcubacteria group bacterium GW2011_GWA2_47_12]
MEKTFMELAREYIKEKARLGDELFKNSPELLKNLSQ